MKERSQQGLLTSRYDRQRNNWVSKTLGFLFEGFLVEVVLQKSQDLTPLFVGIPLKATPSEVIAKVDRDKATTT
jgi:hypothetical protein